MMRCCLRFFAVLRSASGVMRKRLESSFSPVLQHAHFKKEKKMHETCDDDESTRRDTRTHINK